MTEYTVKQIAEVLEVSKPTVQKVINQLNIEAERIENNNRRFYSYTDTLKIIKAVQPEFNYINQFPNFGKKPQSEFCAKPKNETSMPPNSADQTEKPEKELKITEKSSAKPPTEEIELLKSMLSVIQEQLKEKDKQLSIKDQQIKDLSDRLSEAMQLTRGQQYISAADKTTELLEVNKKRGQQKSSNIRQNKGFLKKIFGKT